MNIQIRLIETNSSILNSYIPERYLRDYNFKNSYFFAAVDSNEYVLGIIYYTENNKKKKALELNYIYIKEEYRNQGLATRLIKDTLELFKKNNIVCVNTNRILDSNIQLSSILKSLGFASDSTGEIYIFSLYTISEKIFTPSTMEKLTSYINNVRCLSQIQKPLLNNFCRQIKREGSFFDSKSVDNFHTLFYEVSGELLGCVSLRPISSEIVFLEDVFVLKKGKSSDVLISILGTLSEQYVDDMDVNSALAVDSKTKRVWEPIQKLTGDPVLIIPYTSYTWFN